MSRSAGPQPAVWAQALFDDGPVAAFELHGPGDEASLLPAEAALVAQAPPGRRAEFAAGRQCARAALTALGRPGEAVLRGVDRSPRWPAGVVGSITHAGAYCLAVARGAEAGMGSPLGVDAERLGRVRPELYDLLFTEGEQRWVRQLPAADGDELSTVLFSAKESLYKAQFARTSSWLGFLDVELTSGDGALVARPASSSPVLGQLRWPQPIRHLRSGALVVTGTSLR